MHVAAGFDHFAEIIDDDLAIVAFLGRARQTGQRDAVGAGFAFFDDRVIGQGDSLLVIPVAAVAGHRHEADRRGYPFGQGGAVELDLGRGQPGS